MLIDWRWVHKVTLCWRTLCVRARRTTCCGKLFFCFLGVHDFPWAVSQRWKKARKPLFTLSPHLKVLLWTPGKWKVFHPQKLITLLVLLCHTTLKIPLLFTLLCDLLCVRLFSRRPMKRCIAFCHTKALALVLGYVSNLSLYSQIWCKRIILVWKLLMDTTELYK